MLIGILMSPGALALERMGLVGYGCDVNTRWIFISFYIALALWHRRYAQGYGTILVHNSNGHVGFVAMLA